MSRVWSAREPDDSGVVRAYVKRLRQKLGETADNPRYIFNEPRVGYRLGEPEEQDEGSAMTVREPLREGDRATLRRTVEEDMNELLCA